MPLFLPVLSQMAFLFTCIFLGWLLSRLHILPGSTDKALSRLETYLIAPALVINSFRTNCTPENLRDNGSLLLYSAALLVFSFLLTAPLVRFFTKDREETGIYRYSLMVPNFGFVGNALVLGMYGEEGLFRFLIFTLPTTVFVYTVGVMWLTAGRQKITWRSFVNPAFLSVIAGVIIGLTRFPLPQFAVNTVTSLAACYSPVAMLLTGIVIAHFDLKELFVRKNVYALTFVRLVVIPLIVWALVRMIDMPDMARLMILVFSVMPLGMNTIVYPAAYGLNEKPGAAMAVISSLAGLVTVPLLLSFMLP